MRLWRIGSALFPVWNGEGARLKGGRWNLPGTPAIYASTSYAAAVLEVLVHANTGRVPPGLRHIVVDVPDDAKMQRLRADDVPDWDAIPPDTSRRAGNDWLRGKSGLVLLVPSVITGGMDMNAIVNPLHPDFATITVGEEDTVRWDPRLLAPRP